MYIFLSSTFFVLFHSAMDRALEHPPLLEGSELKVQHLIPKEPPEVNLEDTKQLGGGGGGRGTLIKVRSQPITRSVQMPYIHVMPFSQAYLFLDRISQKNLFIELNRKTRR